MRIGKLRRQSGVDVDGVELRNGKKDRIGAMYRKRTRLGRIEGPVTATTRNVDYAKEEKPDEGHERLEREKGEKG